MVVEVVNALKVRWSYVEAAIISRVYGAFEVVENIELCVTLAIAGLLAMFAAKLVQP
jgi:hypothetical protein